MRRFLTIALFGAFLLAGALASCEKKNIVPEVEVPERADSAEDLLRDSVYMYTYLLYLWQESLPVQFQTRRYPSAEGVLEALKGFARDPQGNAYDRFSFLDRSGTIDAEIQQGLAGSFGFDVRYDNETDLYVKKVDPESPAASAGLARAWQILEINGNANLSQSSMEQDNFTFLFSALDAQSISLLLRTPDGQVLTRNINRGSYRIQPILNSRVFDVGSKRVGYFAFDSFVSTSDLAGSPTYVRNQLNQLLGQFETAGVDELIVDLRYNGGGAVITAEYLSNMLAPASVGTGLMYNYSYNQTLQQAGWNQVFVPEYFNKTNALDVDRIYFLVTGSTASASELLINNLRPHMEVKLIGENATYGKPVGYFAWDVMGVDLYAVSFQTFNSTGFGDYFDGMPVDKLAYDDLTRDFGDAEEDLIAEALYYARHGSFLPAAAAFRMGPAPSREASLPQLNRTLDERGTKDMFDFRRGNQPRR